MPWPFSAGGDQSGSTQSRLDDSEPLDVHSWGDHETHIRVTNPDGFAVKVRRREREGEREAKENEKKTKTFFLSDHLPL
jgi:hypothetical protein